MQYTVRILPLNQPRHPGFGPTQRLRSLQTFFHVGKQGFWSTGFAFSIKPVFQGFPRANFFARSDFPFCIADSDWPQLRGLAILALRGALNFFAVLLWYSGENMMNYLTASLKSSKIPNHSHPVPFIFVSYCLIVCFNRQ